MTYALLALLALTSCASRSPAVADALGDQQLRVTTWNVRKLGRQTFAADERLFGILNETDIIAFQEVNARDTGREALRILRDGMSQRTGRKLCYALTRPATGERYEVFGFIWRNDRLARAWPDGRVKEDCPESADEIPLARAVEDRMVREPAVLGLVFKPNGRRFVLINAHLVPQNRRRPESDRRPELEVAPLFEITDEFKEPVLVVGDFNLSPRGDDRRGDPFAPARTRGFSASLVGVRTSLKLQKRDFAHEYDNLWTRGLVLEGIGRINVFDKFPEKSPLEIVRTLSDHAPVTGAYTFP